MIDLKPLIEHRDKSRCVLGFDIWGTLLDLDEVLKSIAKSIARKIGVSEHVSEQMIYEVHRAARNIRRRNPDIKPSELLQVSQKLASEKFGVSTETLLGTIAEVFENPAPSVLFKDTLPALEALHEKGVAMGLIGNVLFWPSSLTRKLLESYNLVKYMKILVFSDEIEVSKPDRKIFLFFAEKMGTSPENVIYVGDNIIEDVGGALASGFIGILIDRKSNRKLYVPELRAGVIRSLEDLPSVYEEICG